MSLKKDIISILPSLNWKFSATEVAEMLGIKIETLQTRGYVQSSCYKVTRVLRTLCQEGYLYQWIKGVGTLSDLTDNASKWEMYYLKREHEASKEIAEKRKCVGYRIR